MPGTAALSFFSYNLRQIYLPITWKYFFLPGSHTQRNLSSLWMCTLVPLSKYCPLCSKGVQRPFKTTCTKVCFGWYWWSQTIKVCQPVSVTTRDHMWKKRENHMCSSVVNLCIWNLLDTGWHTFPCLKFQATGFVSKFLVNIGFYCHTLCMLNLCKLWQLANPCQCQGKTSFHAK